MTAAEIIAAARECLGAPWRHQGRSLDTGLDCAGLVVHVAAVVGCEVIDISGYGRSPAGGQIEALLDAQPCLLRVLDIDERQPGDVLLMQFAGVSEPQHLAILCEDELLVHAWATVRKVTEHRADAAWLAKVASIMRVYRFAEIEA
jgi:cell wall-associated NlpC family hydrolase